MSGQKARSEAVAQLVCLARREQLSCDDFAHVCEQVRKKLKLKRGHRLPSLLAVEEPTRFFKAILKGGQVQHEIMVLRLIFAAVRVGKLIKI